MLLYALTILVRAFLLFQVQPVIAKIILPWFGGSAAVWTTCLLFFQMVLLLGYLYSHAVVRYLRPRTQMVLHVCLLVVSVAVLPIYPSAAWKPTGGGEPTLQILGLLAVSIGLPYFLLSTTGPLLQAWYARRYHGAMPYRLYALSNAGSMFALISYPVLFEPMFGTHRQATGWSIAYGLFAALAAVTAFRSGSGVAVEAPVESEDAMKPGVRQYVLWMALPACASVLLLGITNHLSANVAAIPFLWVLPLSLYLLTFILCFESDRWYRRWLFTRLAAVALPALAYAISSNTDISPLKIALTFFCTASFVLFMVCHGELARRRPAPAYLTSFYLMVSVGGAMGGLLIGVAAPYLTNALYDLPVVVALTAFLFVYLLWERRGKATSSDFLDAPYDQA